MGSGAQGSLSSSPEYGRIIQLIAEYSSTKQNAESITIYESILMHAMENIKFHRVSCGLTEFEESVSKAMLRNKTPLILDSSQDEKVCTYLTYRSNCVILDAKQMVLEGRNQTPRAILERARTKLAGAMFHGKTLVIRLANSVPDFLGKYCDQALPDKLPEGKALFPKEVFIRGGTLLKTEEWCKKLYREEDTLPHKNLFFCRDEFNVVVVSMFSYQDACEFLFPPDGKFGLPPKENFSAIEISYDEED